MFRNSFNKIQIASYLQLLYCIKICINGHSKLINIIETVSVTTFKYKKEPIMIIWISAIII